MADANTRPPSAGTFDAFHASLQSRALATTRKAAVGLPSDVAFHRSMDARLADDLDALEKRVLLMANRLLGLVLGDEGAGNGSGTGTGKGKARLEDADDVVDNFHSVVVDAMDQLLERTDISLDEFLGKNKAPAIAINAPITSRTKVSADKTRTTTTTTSNTTPQVVVQHAAHLPKPQLKFETRADNSDAPWHPTLPHKYNAQVPLGHILLDAPSTSTSSSSTSTSPSTLLTNHPYHYEITHLTYPSHLFTPPSPPPPFTPLDAPHTPTATPTPAATWVDTPAALHAMLGALRGAREIAVDLEHHSYRTYGGFLCLMQLSTRAGADYLVDLLDPGVRREVGVLNEVFTDPAVVKVFHGAESDIVWLQQDFNIYIVNLFDTFHASKLLEFPRHGLANLLEMYCDFVPDKRYQLADWRIRPLPEDMLKYARADTHFLLYIYDNLRNALIDRAQSQSRSQSRAQSPVSTSLTTSSTSLTSPFPSLTTSPSTTTTSPSTTSLTTSPTPSSPAHALLLEALHRSAETSLRVYAKEPYDAADGTGSGGWDTLARKWNKGALMAGGPGVGAGALQRAVYRGVHGWRERVAREEDESTRYVLANHVLFQLAEQPPADMAALLGLFRSGVPPMVKKRAKELLAVIKDAVRRGMAAATRMSGEEAPVPAAAAAVEPLPTTTTTLTTTTATTTTSRRDVVMLDAEMKSLEDTENLEDTANIWGRPAQQAASTSHSALFGKKANAKAPTTPFAASASTLFKPSSSAPRFQDLVAKINRSFTLGSAAPQIAAPTAAFTPTPTAARTAEAPANVQADSERFDEATGMQVEIAYTPAGQRATKAGAQEPDTIVVVGQARQKRKRREPRVVGVAGDGAAAAGSVAAGGSVGAGSATRGAGGNDDTEKAEKVEEEAETFDFAAVSNILDDNPDTEDRKKKRQRKVAKGGQFFGDFPAPPKAYSELKSGNQSHTFK